jgi:signal transduction histidine kinase
LYFKNVDPGFMVIADQNRLTQVISNMIDNSIKFILREDGKDDADDGLISIGVEKTKIHDIYNNITNTDELIINIKDNGKGIDPDIFPRLFTKFASKSFQGTGLGLYISKNIVEAHGGRIWAKNNENGKGATFSFSFPLINDTNAIHHLDEKD